MSLLSWIVTFFLMAGVFFFIVGSVGILRFPDFYSRLHAAGKCDTLASALVLGAIALFGLRDFDWNSLQSWENLRVSLKVMMIVLFVCVASPSATHAITKAAFIVGVEPWEKRKRNR
ncbi:MAG: monovalent cation/H(+) antiporter subunit G [Deltaproteobacteria bacterium]|nr:monovalent cation/H(+) antiporter subunit G [Deltaproteobacteria bacterium]